jgi:hypothetical protein
MTRWEYADVTWQPDQVIVTTVEDGDRPTTETYPATEWPQLLAKLGYDGWEMVSCTASPVGAHEYYFYFKRPYVG